MAFTTLPSSIMLIKIIAVLSVLAPAAAQLEAISLGSACDFAILSKSGVSSVGPSVIGGNVGTSPIAATALTGFDLTPTNAGTAEFSKSSQVDGNLYGASHLSPTPPMLGRAVFDMEAAYTKASGLVPADFVEYGTDGVIPDGAVLAPGIYKWSGVVTTPTHSTITFSGSETDVWVMQIAGNLALNSYTTIVLEGGAKAENIFWAVHGDIAVGTYSHAEGIMLTYTMIALKTGASLNGAAYAQTAITLDHANVQRSVGGFCAVAPLAAPVDVGGACAFSILSKSGVTNISPSHIGGDVGTSPIAATALTGFALVPTNAGTADHSTSVEVDGNLYGASHAGGTPAMLTTAVLEMEAAYTEASHRGPVDYKEYGTGGVIPDGAILAPGIYKWMGVVTTPTHSTITFKGGPTDVWIMQIAGNLALNSYTTVKLEGGAQARNIIWAVHGDIAVGTYSHAEGIMMTYTMIALKTGSSLNGAAYAQTAITLDKVNVNGIEGFCDPLTNAPTNAPTPGPTEAPNVAPTEAPNVAPTVPATPAPTSPKGEAFAKGDPHFKTLSGELYDFHGGCDLVLMNNPGFMNGLGMAVHIRTKIETWWSYVDAVAVKIGSATVELNGGINTEWFFIDGNPNEPLEDGKWYESKVSGFLVRYKQISIDHREANIYLGGGEVIVLKSYRDFVKVNMNMKHDENYIGALGMLGRFPDGERVGRDSVTFIEDVNAFGQEWQVLATEPNLFHSNLGVVQSPEMCAMPLEEDQEKTFLRKRRLIESGVGLEVAENACSHVVEPGEKKACIYDVLATNDVNMAGAF